MLRAGPRNTARHDLAAIRDVFLQFFDIFIVDVAHFIYAKMADLRSPLATFTIKRILHQ